jgi:hypothetical protein
LLTTLCTLAYLFFLVLACRRTSKSQLLKKLQKAFTFRPDNQRQISLSSSHACKYWMRLINLVNFATFHVEYSKLAASTVFTKRDVLLSEKCVSVFDKCVHVSEEVSLYSHSLFIHVETCFICELVFSRVRIEEHFFEYMNTFLEYRDTLLRHVIE